MLLKYCARCREETRHRKLKKAGLFTQFVLAVISAGTIDLDEPDYECNACGHRSDA